MQTKTKKPYAKTNKCNPVGKYKSKCKRDLHEVKSVISNKSVHVSNEYFVCKSSSWEDNGPMVECQASKNWYHYSCILRRKREISGGVFDERQIKYICGYSNCRFENNILVVNGKYIPLKKSSESVLVEENDDRTPILMKLLQYLVIFKESK